MTIGICLCALLPLWASNGRVERNSPIDSGYTNFPPSIASTHALVQYTNDWYNSLICFFDSSQTLFDLWLDCNNLYKLLGPWTLIATLLFCFSLRWLSLTCMCLCVCVSLITSPSLPLIKQSLESIQHIHSSHVIIQHHAVYFVSWDHQHYHSSILIQTIIIIKLCWSVELPTFFPFFVHWSVELPIHIHSTTLLPNVCWLVSVARLGIATANLFPCI